MPTKMPLHRAESLTAQTNSGTSRASTITLNSEIDPNCAPLRLPLRPPVLALTEPKSESASRKSSSDSPSTETRATSVASVASSDLSQQHRLLLTHHGRASQGLSMAQALLGIGALFSESDPRPSSHASTNPHSPDDRERDEVDLSVDVPDDLSRELKPTLLHRSRSAPAQDSQGIGPGWDR